MPASAFFLVFCGPPALLHIPADLRAFPPSDNILAVSTVAEIEAAIEHLPTKEMLQVAEWLDEYRALINTSENLFQRLDAEEGEHAGQQWLGP